MLLEGTWRPTELPVTKRGETSSEAQVHGGAGAQAASHRQNLLTPAGPLCTALPAPRGRAPSLTAPSTVSLPPRSREEKGETQHWRHFKDGNTEARRPRGACLGPRQQSEFLLGPQSSAGALCCLLKAHLALEMDFLT